MLPMETSGESGNWRMEFGVKLFFIIYFIFLNDHMKFVEKKFIKIRLIN